MTIVKVKHPALLPSVETLRACKVGLTNRINREESKHRRERLKEIKKEIEDLIEAL